MLASAVLALAMPGSNVQIWCNPSQQHDESTSPCSADTDSSDPAWYLQRCVFVYMFIIVSVTMVTSHTHKHSEMNLLSHFYITGRFAADNLNKAKNLCSKSIGEKMKVC